MGAAALLRSQEWYEGGLYSNVEGPQYESLVPNLMRDIQVNVNMCFVCNFQAEKIGGKSPGRWVRQEICYSGKRFHLVHTLCFPAAPSLRVD